jgi:hypothetical protein
MTARRSILLALVALAATLCGTPSAAKEVSTSRAFGKAIYAETISEADGPYRFVGIPDRSIALSISLGGISFTDRGRSFNVEISVAHCRAATGLDGYQDVDTRHALSIVIDTTASRLLKSCGLSASALLSERRRIDADFDDLLAAILFMKSRATALSGSLVRCEHRSDSSFVMTLDGQSLPSCSTPRKRNGARASPRTASGRP